MKNYYQTLQLESDASQEEIKRAYRLYAAKFHPDKHQGDRFFEERFKEVQEAYEVLSDVGKRADYDERIKPKSASNPSSRPAPQASSRSPFTETDEKHLHYSLDFLRVTATRKKFIDGLGTRLIQVSVIAMLLLPATSFWIKNELFFASTIIVCAICFAGGWIVCGIAALLRT